MKALLESLRLFVLVAVAMVLLFGLFFAPDVIVDPLHSLTRSDCLLHRPWLVLIFAVADGVIWLAYWSMPVTFLRLAFSKAAQRDPHYSITTWVFSWMAAFIFLCGLNHLFDLLVLRYSFYEEFAYIKVALALVSVYTALYVVRQIQRVTIVPRGLLQHAVQELHEIMNQPANSIQEYRRLLQKSMHILDSIAETREGK